MKLSAIVQHNSSISIARERLVVIGGTQGIGEGVAYRFARAGAEVWIVGRNEENAKGVLQRLRAISAENKIDPPPEHAFLKADLSLVSESKRITKEICTRAGEQGVEYLVMTQGGPPNGTFVPTSEGKDQHFAVQVLSRCIIAHELAGDPTSSTVKKAVTSIMAPGKSWQTVDPDDMELETARARGTYGLISTASRDTTIIDSMTQDLAKMNPHVNFTHIFPGFVKTNVMRNTSQSWYISYLTIGLTALLGVTPLEYAEVPFYLLAQPEGRVLAAREMYTDDKLAPVIPAAGVLDKNLREKICDYLSDIYESK